MGSNGDPTGPHVHIQVESPKHTVEYIPTEIGNVYSRSGVPRDYW